MEQIKRINWMDNNNFCAQSFTKELLIKYKYRRYQLKGQISLIPYLYR